MGDQLKLGRLSFASNDDLKSMLGVEPGSVTPIAIINNESKRVKLLFDNDLLTEEYISIHPMVNTATIAIRLGDLLQFIKNNHQEKIEFIDIPNHDSGFSLIT